MKEYLLATVEQDVSISAAVDVWVSGDGRFEANRRNSRAAGVTCQIAQYFHISSGAANLMSSKSVRPKRDTHVIRMSFP